MKITKQLVTPTRAKELLESNTSNRTLNHNRVIRYATDIMNGNWQEDTAEPIKITKKGTLIDGQHRLNAIIRANKEISLWIAEGVPEETFTVIDSGKSRSSADVFKIARVKNSAGIPPIIQFSEILKNGFADAHEVKQSDKLTNQDLLKIYQKDEDYWQETYKQTLKYYNKFGKILNTTTIGSFLTYFRTISPVDAEEFFEQLCSGVYDNSSILICRNKLIADKTNKLRKLPVKVKNAFIVKTWNAFRKGKENKILKWNPVLEDFPKAI
jgi:hypothetical protein